METLKLIKFNVISIQEDKAVYLALTYYLILEINI